MMWLMRPVLENLITFDKLLDPRVRLAHIALMNDALAVRDTNQYRLNEKR